VVPVQGDVCQVRRSAEQDRRHIELEGSRAGKRLARQAGYAGWRVMARWRVDYLGSKGKHRGTVDAPDEKAAIEEAVKMFQITPARRFQLMVTKVRE
jgi:hypothetical protein